MNCYIDCPCYCRYCYLQWPPEIRLNQFWIIRKYFKVLSAFTHVDCLCNRRNCSVVVRMDVSIRDSMSDTDWFSPFKAAFSNRLCCLDDPLAVSDTAFGWWTFCPDGDCLTIALLVDDDDDKDATDLVGSLCDKLELDKISSVNLIFANIFRAPRCRHGCLGCVRLIDWNEYFML
jgi:hypothetical protein